MSISQSVKRENGRADIAESLSARITTILMGIARNVGSSDLKNFHKISVGSFGLVIQTIDQI